MGRDEKGGGRKDGKMEHERRQAGLCGEAGILRNAPLVIGEPSVHPSFRRQGTGCSAPRSRRKDLHSPLLRVLPAVCPSAVSPSPRLKKLPCPKSCHLQEQPTCTQGFIPARLLRLASPAQL